MSRRVGVPAEKGKRHFLEILMQKTTAYIYYYMYSRLACHSTFALLCICNKIRLRVDRVKNLQETYHII